MNLEDCIRNDRIEYYVFDGVFYFFLCNNCLSQFSLCKDNAAYQHERAIHYQSVLTMLSKPLHHREKLDPFSHRIFTVKR